MTTTRERIRAARVAVRAYERAKGCAEQAPAEVVCDLLTDLRHYCARRRIDWETALQYSDLHFRYEADEGNSS